MWKYAVLFALWLMPSVACATTYYVATPGGGGNDLNAGTIGAPWATVGKAMATMVAGDTTFIRGGTYTEKGLNFTNSGTAGNVITLAAYPGETPIITSGLADSNGRDPVFNINGKSYVTLDGLSVTHGSQANILVSYDTNAEHVTIQNCDLYDFWREDNSGSIFINPGAADLVIQNNTIHGVLIGTGVGATNGIMLLFTSVAGSNNNVTIQNNEIYGGMVSGIHYKHSAYDSDSTSQTIIKNNLIHTSGTRSIISNRNYAQITNNVVYGGGICLTLFISEGVGSGAHTTVAHNTFVCDGGIQIDDPSSNNNLIENNIIYAYTASQDTRAIALNEYVSGSDTTVTTLRYCLFYSASVVPVAHVAGAYYNFGSIPGSVLDQTGLINSAPIFVNEAGNNYTLTSLSPGYHAASDGTDIGACIVQVGVGNAVNSCTGGGGGAGGTTGRGRSRLRVDTVGPLMSVRYGD